ncbi:MAG: GntR family transcriptional regulator [Desulfarculus sp.]|nr:GntR family transcriptional regulator [Pseudomonadota bacterium]MBV1716023.1 GntR family transcriptional regulator [Desulfarculus sp.]MBU4575174.1 GntR family transcriptional regulator [Pseudomonadota bacterium]MBU4596607.1 GntR family transcriptional regulator [Pseudomonadota bacterium]MBV1738460.1 GntR family transcriptional regulator [Desulfarculus sp.]
MPFKRGVVIEEAYNKIKEMIYSNQLAPGQKIIYTDLAKKLQMSVTPLIHALNRLEASDFVSYVPNKGYFLNEITVDEATQLYEVREALELHALPKVIENIAQAHLDQIKKASKKYRHLGQVPADRDLFLADARFHLQLVKISGNDILHRMLKEIFEKLYLKYPPQYMDTARLKEIASEHRSLLQALARRDTVAAAAITKLHIAQGRERILGSLRIRQQEMLSLP